MIAVTGLGAFCAAGDSAESLWQSTLAGKSHAVFESGERIFAVSRAPEIARELPKILRNSDRCARLAFVAAEQALRQAGLTAEVDPERIGLALGTSRGPIEKLESGFVQSQGTRIKPTALISASFGSLGGAIAQSFGLLGPTSVLSNTCASASAAISWAADQILLGRADVMLAGGSDAPLTASILAQLEAAGMTGHHTEAPEICRPFAEKRTGIVPGEGAGFLILESLDHAKKRGALPLAFLSGWSCGMDLAGRSDIDPEGSGLARTIRSTLASAGLSAADIDHINTHGTGTPQNDLGESRAIETVFGTDVPCVSIKPVTGHCMGASPALEAVVCVKALENQILPPSRNSTPRDPRCRIAINTAPACRSLRHVLSNSSGLWGYHACLVFSSSAGIADCAGGGSII